VKSSAVDVIGVLVRSRSLLLLWLLALLHLAPSVRADEAADARSHFERGTAHYALGEFSQAAEE
jgi:hypothetical protein